MKIVRLLLIGGVLLVISWELSLLLQKDKAPVLHREHYYASEDFTIQSIKHQTRIAVENNPFSRFEGDALGLSEHNNFSVLEFFQPASRGRGIASGDFNNDGWQDILLGTNQGLLLYKNMGQYKFVPQDINLANIEGLDLGVHVASFADIDNNGWQDIYLTTYEGKNYFLLNDARGFRNPQVLEIPNTRALVTTAVSFGDIDKDGNLDFVQGNWLPLLFPSKTAEETNTLIRNKNLEFSEEDLEEIPGQTLSVLFADFTNDHNLDLITGEEFESPDHFHRGDGEGGLREVKRSEGLIPGSAHFSMGTDVADFNNDLYMDIYMSGVSTYKVFTETPCAGIQSIKERQACEKNYQIIDIVRKEDMEKCATLAENRDKNECAAMVLLRLAVQQQDEGLCAKIPENYRLQQFACLADSVRQAMNIEIHPKAIPQIPWQNVLLQGSTNGKFVETAQGKGVHHGLSSWNAKFADLDNDEWQDIYIGAGELTPSRPVFQPNIFFHNYEGQFFKQEQEEFGLEDFNIVPSYTYVDIDNDGDLDIITAPLNGPLNVYINNEGKNNSITFAFKDRKGNSVGVGNKVYIYYGENNERHQVREIKSGGGFLSFDPPIAHFGLGKYDTVKKVEIVWSTGEKTEIDKEFLANKNYVIERKK